MGNIVKNFQEEFSLQDIEIARDVRATHDCGMSRIALIAPNQVRKVYRTLIKDPGSNYVEVVHKTLKLHYAIQVWCRAAMISARNPNDMLYYWWLRWKPGEGAFNELEYSNFNRNITEHLLLKWFWQLLEVIADSGVIQVTEGFWTNCEGVGNDGPNVVCDCVIDKESPNYWHIKDYYNYSYNTEPKTYKWEEIKDLFVELTLDQLRLTMPEKLHKHTNLDDVLLYASSVWDTDLINHCISHGTNINCLSTNGESVLQRAVEDFKVHGMLIDKDYTPEEKELINATNLQKCKEIVDLLLSHGADINLYGFGGKTPLLCAYYENSPEMVNYLLELGADPNVNCEYDDVGYWKRIKNIRCSILNSMDDLEEMEEPERQIAKAIHDYGGRQYVWDYTPWDDKNIGKYVVRMTPSKDGDTLFVDNDDWWIGTTDDVMIEDESGEQTMIDLNMIDGLKEWLGNYQENIENFEYDWKTWHKRGRELAEKVAEQLPDTVALFYLRDNEKVVDKNSSGKVTLSSSGKYIRIK